MSSVPPTEAALILPPGWVMDWISLDRLARQLAVAPPAVAGIAASVGPIPPGASYRTHAERCALRPMSDLTPLDGAGDGAGAVLRRDRAGGAVGPSSEVALVDRGAHAHDPVPENGPTQPASAEGRSPFPVRPVVLFVHEGSSGFDDRIRVLVNDLLGLDIEARIASPAVPPGRHLTAPCSPVLASARALVPDIFVPVDEASRALVGHWAEATRRSVIAVDVDENGPDAELLSWQRGSGDGRTRARVSSGVDPRRFADLVVRLSSGPRPLRPTDVGLR